MYETKLSFSACHGKSEILCLNSISARRSHKIIPESVILGELTDGRVFVCDRMQEARRIGSQAPGRVLAHGLADDLPGGGGTPPTVGGKHDLVEAWPSQEVSSSVSEHE